MSEPWWAGLGPVEVRLDCGGEAHVVCWQDGELTAPEHGDLVGERILAALAGERPTCLQVLELWERHRHDLQVLVVASRGPGDPLGGATRRPSRGWVAYAPLSAHSQAAYSSSLSWSAKPGAPARASGDPSEHSELAELVELAGPLLDRLAGTVAGEWAERVRANDDRVAANRAALEAALYGRVLLAARSWMADPALDVVLRMIDADEEPSIERVDGAVSVAVPFEWLSTIWARGLAVVLGRFVLAASQDSAGSVVLHTVDATFSLQRKRVLLSRPR